MGLVTPPRSVPVRWSSRAEVHNLPDKEAASRQALEGGVTATISNLQTLPNGFFCF